MSCSQVLQKNFFCAVLKLLKVSLFLMEISRVYPDLLAMQDNILPQKASNQKWGATICQRSSERNLWETYCGMRFLKYSGAVDYSAVVFTKIDKVHVTNVHVTHVEGLLRSAITGTLTTRWRLTLKYFMVAVWNERSAFVPSILSRTPCILTTPTMAWSSLLWMS